MINYYNGFSLKELGEKWRELEQKELERRQKEKELLEAKRKAEQLAMAELNKLSTVETKKSEPIRPKNATGCQ